MPLTYATTRKRLTIGELATQAGIGVETIRFYERQGLIEQPSKPLEGFRVYPTEALMRLTFVHEAQQLGFTLREIRDLLTLQATPGTDVAAVRGRVAAKLAKIEDKVIQLQGMRATLQKLLSQCPGTGALDQCPILEALTTPSRTLNKRRAATGKKATMKTIILTLEGMHCDGCAKTVESLLAAEPGIKAAQASYANKIARVLFDPSLIEDTQVVQAVERAGYRVSEVM